MHRRRVEGSSEKNSVGVQGRLFSSFGKSCVQPVERPRFPFARSEESYKLA
jgi:hypothetical protein